MEGALAVLVTAAIGSAVAPTPIAQTRLRPDFKAIADEPQGKILNR